MRYDAETGFYYLNSRYYDPNTARFINADGQISGADGDIRGFNQFAYCFNNPVNMADHNGNWPKWIKNTVKWLVVEVANPIVKASKKLLSKINMTKSKGTTLGATFGIVGATATPSVAVDTKGNVALQASYSWGITTSPGFSGSIGKTTTITNAPTVTKLDGESGVVGGSIYLPIDEKVPINVGCAIDFNIIPDQVLNTFYYGLSTTIGISTSKGSELHAGMSDTITIFSINVYDIYDKIYETVSGWE